MTATGELIAALVAGGMDAAEAAGLVARAAVEMTAVVNHRSPNARRQQRFRDREKERNEALRSVTTVTVDEIAECNEALRGNASIEATGAPEALLTVTNRNEVTLSNAQSADVDVTTVTEGVTQSATKGFSLSPVPLLSPIPPNNPLTPKPSSKNSFVARDFGDWPDDFQAVFWGIWPHKVGKPAATKALDRVRRNGVSFEVLIDGTNRYIRGKPADRSWMNPATFLNGDRWEDQPASETNGQSIISYRADPTAGRATAREASLLASVGRGAAGRLAERAASRPGGTSSGDAGSASILDSVGGPKNAH